MKFLLLALLIACSDPLSPVCSQFGNDHTRMSVATYKNLYNDARSDFYAQLTGYGNLTLPGLVDLGGDTLDLAPYFAHKTHTVSISGTPGWTGGALYNGQLKISDGRPWVVYLNYVTALEASLDFHWAQIPSVWFGVWLERSSLLLRNNAGLEIHATYFNASSAEFRNTGELTFVGGAFENGTLTISGPPIDAENSWQGPVAFERYRFEHSLVYISDLNTLVLNVAYAVGTTIYVENVRNVYYSVGDWNNSYLFIDGVRQNVDARCV